MSSEMGCLQKAAAKNLIETISASEMTSEIPKIVLTLAGNINPDLVWENEAGGLTYRTGDHYIKWNPNDNGIDLQLEIERLEWLDPSWHVPELHSSGKNEKGSWLITKALDGKSAVDQIWLERPLEAVGAIGIGLRALHDTVPVEGCPFDWGTESRIRHTGIVLDRSTLDSLGSPPSIDRLVVCHGDACSPNTILDSQGKFLAHVDLGSLGVADRWADLAVATMAVTWNFGHGWETHLLDAYGVKKDPLRTDFYRRLWHLTS